MHFCRRPVRVGLAPVTVRMRAMRVHLALVTMCMLAVRVRLAAVTMCMLAVRMFCVHSFPFISDRADAQRLAIKPAIAPAPTPLPMLTTAIPGAQVCSIE